MSRLPWYPNTSSSRRWHVSVVVHRLRETLATERQSPAEGADPPETKPVQQEPAGKSPARAAGGGSLGIPGGSSGEGVARRSGVHWQVMLMEAIEQELGSDGGGHKVQHVELDDDITEEGWLPK